MSNRLLNFQTEIENKVYHTISTKKIDRYIKSGKIRKDVGDRLKFLMEGAETVYPNEWEVSYKVKIDTRRQHTVYYGYNEIDYNMQEAVYKTFNINGNDIENGNNTKSYLNNAVQRFFYNETPTCRITIKNIKTIIYFKKFEIKNSKGE